MYDISKVVKSAINRTVVLDCFEENAKCEEFICKGDYLYKSSETAKYTLKFKIKNTRLGKIKSIFLPFLFNIKKSFI